ncbi:MAG: phosphodiester glycosidase family protein [Sphaerochaeta sp.]|nr:phosphodiester glycosidase family protein [Sphaerochaeta sp.]
MSNSLPCSYSSYQGTKWYRRLVSGEFILQFDQAPEREVIIDHIAEQFPKNEAWENRIRTICTADGETWDRLSPGELVQLLREERKQYIPEARLHWRSSSFADPTNTHGGERTRTYQGPRVFVFPDIYDECPLDEQVSILVAQYEIHTGEDHIPGDRNTTVIVCIPETHKALAPSIRHYPVELMPNPTELQGQRMRSMGKERVILCSDVWYTLAFLSAGIAVHAYLDRREWFASVVLHDNIPDNSPSTTPEQSHYEKLLHTDVENTKTLREYRYLTHIPSNGVEADLAEIVTTPPWVEQAKREQLLTLENGFYKKQEDNTWIRTEREASNTVHVASASFDKDQILMNPVFFAGKHSPLSLSYPDGGFFTSFNYYFTENLKSWYAKQDKRRLVWDDFMLDYLAIPQGDGLYESVPLYNKALLGYGKDGTLFACEGEWTSITLSLNGKKTFEFNKEHVSEVRDTQGQENTSVSQQKTPSEIHFPTDTRAVGEGRWCLTFIHDYLWDASEGPVMVPPFGVVVTTEERIEQVDTVAWAVEWKDLPIEKSEVAWLAGGFNLLVKGRKNLVATQEDTQAQLEKEGWFIPSSLLTQETALDSAGVQPRSVIGTCGTKIMVMSVSGRNSRSKGITFSDAASLAIHLAQEMNNAPLDFLLNLDGGASSVLGCKKDKEASCLLTKPSPSITNPAGCPRCVPSLLAIHLKKQG